MTLRTYLGVLREQWLVVVGFLVVGLLLGGLITMLIPKTYAASFSTYVSAQVGPKDPTEEFQAQQLSQGRVLSYVQLMSSRDVAQDVVHTLGLRTTPDELMSRIAAKADPQSVIIDTAVTADSSGEATRVANAVAASFLRLTGQLEQASNPNGVSAVSVSIVAPAAASANPVSPSPGLNLSLGGFIGLLIGLLVAFGRHALDTSIRTADRLAEVSDAPVLGIVPRSTGNGVVAADSGDRRLLEALKQIRTNLEVARRGATGTAVAVTSAIPEEGRTALVCDLAGVEASKGRSVLVLDADLRRPKTTAYLGVHQTGGLTALLEVCAHVEDVLLWHAAGGFWLIPSGTVPPNPSELLGSSRMAGLLDDLRARFDVILIDTAPVLPVTDTAAVAENVDGVVLACRYGRTTSREATDALRSLRNVSAQVLGVVLTMAPSPTHTYDSYVDSVNEAPGSSDSSDLASTPDHGSGDNVQAPTADADPASDTETDTETDPETDPSPTVRVAGNGSSGSVP